MCIHRCIMKLETTRRVNFFLQVLCFLPQLVPTCSGGPETRWSSSTCTMTQHHNIPILYNVFYLKNKNVPWKEGNWKVHWHHWQIKGKRARWQTVIKLVTTRGLRKVPVKPTAQTWRHTSQAYTRTWCETLIWRLAKSPKRSTRLIVFSPSRLVLWERCDPGRGFRREMERNAALGFTFPPRLIELSWSAHGHGGSTECVQTFASAHFHWMSVAFLSFDQWWETCNEQTSAFLQGDAEESGR